MLRKIWVSVKRVAADLPSPTVILVFFAAPIAYFLGPLLPYSDPINISRQAYTISSGILCLWVLHNFSLYAPKTLFFGKVLLAVIVLMTVLQMIFEFSENAKKVYEAERKRCAVIEKDMLSQSPKVGNGIALFEAFDCQSFKSSKVILPWQLDRQ